MDSSNEEVSFARQTGPSKKGGEYVSAGIPPAGRGHQYQPYQHQQISPQQFVEQQQHQLPQHAPRRENIGGLQVA